MPFQTKRDRGRTLQTASRQIGIFMFRIFFIASLFLRASRGKEFESDPFIGGELGFNWISTSRNK